MKTEGLAAVQREEPPALLSLISGDGRLRPAATSTRGLRDAAWSDGPGRELMDDALLRRGNASCAAETAIHAVISLCLDDLLTGEWDEALRLTGAGLEMCDSHRYHELRWPLWVVIAVIAAVRGDDQQARELAGKLEDWASRRGSPTVQLYASYVHCLLAQAREDFEQAFQCISELAVPATFSANLPLAMAASVDFVESAVRTDRHDVARNYVTMLHSTDFTILSPRMRLLNGCATALAHPNQAGHFERSLAIPGINNLAYDRARVQLAYAERLRRSGSQRTARKHLTDALAAFTELRARPWQSRADRELRGTGMVRIGPAPSPVAALTPQERVIAELAASGLTNKQIGLRIYLSHRTVGTHLHRAFDKLGISTRAALRDALGSSPADQPLGI